MLTGQSTGKSAWSSSSTLLVMAHYITDAMGVLSSYDALVCGQWQYGHFYGIAGYCFAGDGPYL